MPVSERARPQARQGGDTFNEEQIVRIEQRKQNLGMNAMLSVSLALGRAITHLQGKQLYELLREEMLAIVERLAREYDVRIEGSQLADYVRALQAANRVLQSRGMPLYAELRRLTGVYGLDDAARDTPPLARVAAASNASVLVGAPEVPATAEASRVDTLAAAAAVHRGAASLATATSANRAAAAPVRDTPLRRADVLDEADHTANQ